MSSAQGFTMWLSGSVTQGAGAFAAEVRARLTRRGLRVRLWTSQELAEVSPAPAGGRPEKTARDRREELSDGVINIVLDEPLEHTTRDRLRGTLPHPVEVLVGHTGEGGDPAESGPAGARVGDEGPSPAARHEPRAAAVHELAFRGSAETLNDDVSRLLSLLESRGLISSTGADMQHDEQLLIERLTDLGYL